MKKILLLLSLIFPVTTTAEEPPTIGVGYYSIQNKTFPCDKALKAFEGVKKPALMFLWGTFGNEKICLNKFLNLPQKEKEVYIHFSNECCRRNNTCKKGEFLKDTPVWKLNSLLANGDKKTKEAYKKRFNKIYEFIESETKNNTSKITWYISTGLEDNYTFANKKRVFYILKNLKKDTDLKEKIQIYVNPLDGTCINSRCEIHEKRTGNNNHWLFLPDGYCVKPFDACNNNVFTVNELNAKILAQTKNGNKFFIWWSEQQGRYGEPPSKAKPPRQRTIRITDTQVKDANQILMRGKL